jgi:hypothetical protein
MDSSYPKHVIIRFDFIQIRLPRLRVSSVDSDGEGSSIGIREYLQGKWLRDLDVTRIPSVGLQHNYD